LEADEAEYGLSLTREPDPGFVWPMYRWAQGESLARVLLRGGTDGDLSAGDFVRWARQVLDLLGQIAEVPGVPDGVRETARRAMDEVNRGVIAYPSVAL